MPLKVFHLGDVILLQSKKGKILFLPTSTCLVWKEQGFCQRGMGDKPPSNDSRGIFPLNLSFFGNSFSGFENLITLSVPSQNSSGGYFHTCI
jgi:hypothetical protein